MHAYFPPLVVLVDFDKRIYSYIDECFIPFYECRFTQLNFILPFNEFEVGLIRHLKIAPSQMHPKCLGFCKGVPVLVQIPSLEVVPEPLISPFCCGAYLFGQAS